MPTTCGIDFADRDSFYRHVGRLPLTPGKSLLCQSACPALVQHYRDLVVAQQSSSEDNSILRQPETVELDSMLQLVLNCQQRAVFEKDAQVRDNLPPETVVDIPDPGVPFNYLGIPVPDETSDQTTTSTLEKEYDWLRTLVLDQ